MEPSPLNFGEKLTNTIFFLCAVIDIALKPIKDTVIIAVGCSRTGKSTIFNDVNGIKQYGVSAGDDNELDQLGSLANNQIDIIYKPRIQICNVGQANNSIKSVTLIPNKVNKVLKEQNGEVHQCTFIDAPGYLDLRRYKQVIGVSYIIKAILQKVKKIQFLLVLKRDYFMSGGEEQLFKALKGFRNMFNFDIMDQKTKIKLLQSMTVAITRSPQKAQATTYINRMKKILESKDDQEYGHSKTLRQVAFIMEYIVKNQHQIYLFKQAVLDKDAQPSTLFNQHFSKRSFFNLQTENKIFKQINKKNIYNLPFAQDYKNMPNEQDRQKLDQQIKRRIKSMDFFAQILDRFFIKAKRTQNLFNRNLNFNDQFNLIKQYNQVFCHYPSQIDWKQQTGFKTLFIQGDPSKPLKSGISLVQNSFRLYKLFSQLPTYNNQDNPETLQNFIDQYREHIIKIIKIFRDAFCKNYEEQRIILQFLFTAVRACRQYSMLYQIKPQGRYDMCSKINDSFESIIAANTLASIKKSFIQELSRNLCQVCQNVKQNKQQIDKYLKFFKKIQKQPQSADLFNNQKFKLVNKKFIQLTGNITDQPPQKILLSTYENMIQHKKYYEEQLKRLGEQQGQSISEQINFEFLYLLTKIALTLLEINRNQNLEQDPWAYDKAAQIRRTVPQHQIKRYLKKQQLQMAQSIFIYVKNIDQVIKTYQKQIKNTQDRDIQQLYELRKGLAKYLVKNGRIQQGNAQYQKLIGICLANKMCKQYNEVKKAISMIPLQKKQKQQSYYNEMKHTHIIDPLDDQKFIDILEQLYDNYIEPLENKQNNGESTQDQE